MTSIPSHRKTTAPATASGHSDALRARPGRAMLLLLMVTVVGCGDGAARHGPASQPAAAAEPVVRTAQRGPVTVTLTLDRAEVTVPEPLTLTLEVEYESGVDVTLPDLGEHLGEFGVAEMTEADPVAGDFTVRRVRRYRLDTFVPGRHAIPPISVPFADRREKANGSTTVYEDAATTEPISVVVASGLADVRGPVGLPLAGWRKLLLWAVGIVAVMVGVALLARWWRRRRRESGRVLPWAVRLSAGEWALAELDKLDAEDLITQGAVQEYYYRINGLVRRYVELRFDLLAGEQTSEEFVRALQDSSLFGESHKEVLRRFVRACDPVKYARHRPERNEVDWVQSAARDFVIETAPAEGEGQPAMARAATGAATGDAGA